MMTRIVLAAVILSGCGGATGIGTSDAESWTVTQSVLGSDPCGTGDRTVAVTVDGATWSEESGASLLLVRDDGDHFHGSTKWVVGEVWTYYGLDVTFADASATGTAWVNTFVNGAACETGFAMTGARH